MYTSLELIINCSIFLSILQSSSYRNFETDRSNSTSNESSLNPQVFKHRLWYGKPLKTSTDNGRLVRNRNQVLSTSSYRSQTVENSSQPSGNFSTQPLLSYRSAIDSDRFNHDLLYSNKRKNSTAKPRFVRNRNPSSTTDISPSSNYLTDHESERERSIGDEVSDLNNNNIGLLRNDRPPMCFSYMKDCAKYGIPAKDRQKTWSQLFDWWLFSFTYDMKWFVRKESKNILILFTFFILFLICSIYYEYKTGQL